MSDVAQLVTALRARGVTVHEWSGWQNRGNDDVYAIDIKGAVLHHTGSAYGSAYGELVSSSQPWADGGALCNFSGNADGSVTVIAAGLAYHAGGGFGPNQGPLAPYARNRNYYTVGIEIVYPGKSPMTAAQYSTAKVFAKTVADLFCGGDLQYIRGHGEVNGYGYEGKWDPGYSQGNMIDMNAFRAEAQNASGDTFMALSTEQQQYMYESLVDIRTDLSMPWRTNGRSTGQVITDLEAQLTTLENLIKGISAGVVDVNALADALIDKVDVDLVKK